MKYLSPGEKAKMPMPGKIVAELSWKTGVDLDLCALYLNQEGEKGLIYFGNMGFRKEAPFIRLVSDEGLSEHEDGNRETLEIYSPEFHKEICLLIWEFGRVQKGENFQFPEMLVSLKLDFEEKKEEYAIRVSGDADTGNLVMPTKMVFEPGEMVLMTHGKAVTISGVKHIETIYQALQCS